MLKKFFSSLTITLYFLTILFFPSLIHADCDPWTACLPAGDVVQRTRSCYSICTGEECQRGCDTRTSCWWDYFDVGAGSGGGMTRWHRRWVCRTYQVCDFYCWTTSFRCNYSTQTELCCSAQTPRCGTAGGKVFLNTDSGYGSFSQCLDSTNSTNKKFPEKGETVTWQCKTYCSGTPTCTVSRNRYPTFEDLTIPAPYDKKKKCEGANGKDCDHTSTCANKASCLEITTDYSDNFVDKKAWFYREKTCPEANPNEKGQSDARFFSSTVPNLDSKQYFQGIKDGFNQYCYRQYTCDEITSDVEDPANPGTFFKYTTNDCSVSNGKIPLIVNSPYTNGPAGNTNVSNHPPCVVCLTATHPWFQIRNGNLYADNNAQIAADAASDVYVMRNNDCTSSPAGVGIPITGQQLSKIPSQKTTDTGNVAVALSKGTVNTTQETFDFFVNKFGYTRQSLIAALTENATVRDAKHFYEQNYPAAQTANGQTYLSLTDLSLEDPLHIKSTEKKTLFVFGNLQINDKIIVDNGGSVLFVVTGNIVINPEVGQFIDPESIPETQTTCNVIAAEQISLAGVFVANGKITFSSGVDGACRDAQSSPFCSPKVSLACDKSLIVKGAFIGWQGITISRTFAGCVAGFTHKDLTTPYLKYTYDLNATHPVFTTIYDVNLIKNLPNWVMRINRQTYEVN